jgi:hydrogenase expression/formation protein HypC
MCLGRVARVVEVDEDGLCATLTTGDRAVQALLVVIDQGTRPVQPGDWLLIHSGLAVRRLEADEARELLELMASTSTDGGVE